MWPATGGYTLLHSGRPTPSDDVNVVVRREGVGPLLSQRAAGEVLRAG